MNIPYIMPKSIFDVKNQLNVDLFDLEKHISKYDKEAMDTLKTIFTTQITRPLFVGNELCINMEALPSKGAGYVYDGETVVVPDEDIEDIRRKSYTALYSILKAYVEFYNEHSDPDVLDDTLLSNYIAMKAVAVYRKQKSKAFY